MDWWAYVFTGFGRIDVGLSIHSGVNADLLLQKPEDKFKILHKNV